jgi:hypothetical protein
VPERAEGGTETVFHKLAKKKVLDPKAIPSTNGVWEGSEEAYGLAMLTAKEQPLG